MGDRYPSDWDSRRKKVYKRDNYRCRRCGSRGGSRGNAELHAHHMNPVSEGGSHRYGNLKTVCKPCHEDIHGHGVGGRSNSTSGSSTGSGEEIDPAALAVSILLTALIAVSAVTYGAAVQVLPAGQQVSEDFTVEYGTVTEDPDGGRDYDYNVGPPLLLRYVLEDNVISENGETKLRVKLHNPSNNRLEGNLKIIGKTNYRLNGEIDTLRFNLSPGETTGMNITLPGSSMVADSGFTRRTTEFNAEASIYNDPYKEIDTDETEITPDKMTLKVRKPFFNRIGFYWLAFLGVVLSGVGYVFSRKREDVDLF